MATSSGISSWSGSGSRSGRIPSSGSEEDLRLLMDQRKRRRMESNRESARRSRMRKQKQAEDLTIQIDQLQKENNQILTSVNITTQQFVKMEAENSVLRAQMMELSHRLDSLNEILAYINMSNQNGVVLGTENYNDGFMSNEWNQMYMNQPIMANDDMFLF